MMIWYWIGGMVLIGVAVGVAYLLIQRLGGGK